MDDDVCIYIYTCYIYICMCTCLQLCTYDRCDILVYHKEPFLEHRAILLGCSPLSFCWILWSSRYILEHFEADSSLCAVKHSSCRLLPAPICSVLVYARHRISQGLRDFCLRPCEPSLNKCPPRKKGANRRTPGISRHRRADN